MTKIFERKSTTVTTSKGQVTCRIDEEHTPLVNPFNDHLDEVVGGSLAECDA